MLTSSEAVLREVASHQERPSEIPPAPPGCREPLHIMGASPSRTIGAGLLGFGILVFLGVFIAIVSAVHWLVKRA
jgi:hypothetical protein